MGFFDFFKPLGKGLQTGLKTAPKVLDQVTEIEALKQAIPIVKQADEIKDAAKAVAASLPESLSVGLMSLPEGRLSEFLVRFGHAFGPPQLLHFSELSTAAQQDVLKRIPVLQRNHDDWPAPFNQIPRRSTVWFGPAPSARLILEGNVTTLKPIPERGEWYVMPGYMASTTLDGWHDRVGWRYDDIDHYYELSFTIKKF